MVSYDWPPGSAVFTLPFSNLSLFHWSFLISSLIVFLHHSLGKLTIIKNFLLVLGHAFHFLFCDGDDDELFLWYGWPTKDVKSYFQPRPLSEILFSLAVQDALNNSITLLHMPNTIHFLGKQTLFLSKPYAWIIYSTKGIFAYKRNSILSEILFV